LANVDDLDEQVEEIEKFYDLCEKLSIRLITIEEALVNQQKEEKKLGKISLLNEKNDFSSDIDGQNYKDFVKLYFSNISDIPLLTPEEEKVVVRKVKQ